MFNILLWQSKLRIFFGVTSLLLILFWIPEGLTERLWVGVVLGLACPLLVLGRRRELNREAYAMILSSLPRRRRWQLWGLTPALFIVVLWSMVIAQGSWHLGLIFVSWGVCCVSIADLFDKRLNRLPEAWLSTVISVAILGGAPFWGALLFGRTAFAPWIATLCISAHPVYSGLKSVGKLSLQDEILYEVTQSGLVEVHPLPWWFGSIILVGISVLCCEITARSTLREAM